MSMMKKFFAIVGILLFIIIASILVLPIIFEDDIAELVKKTANEQVDAKIDFGEYELSILSTFPDFKFQLENLKVDGIDTFSGTQLAFVRRLDLIFDLSSVFSDQIQIKQIAISQPKINVVVLKNGKANYDISKPSSTSSQTDSKEEEPSKFKASLQEFKITDANINYVDKSLPFEMEIKNLNHKLEGDFTQDKFILKTLTDIRSITMVQDGIGYLRRASFDAKVDLDMDMPNMKFTFTENEINLNQLVLGFDGFVKMNDPDINMDVNFFTKKTDFKTLLSLVPLIYKRDFESVKVKGTLGLKGHVKGTYNDNNMPAFLAELQVDQGNVKYPDLPSSLDNINIYTKISSDGGPNLDNTIVDVSKFHVDIANNPLDMHLLLTQPISDPNFDCKILADIDLNKIKSAIPLEKGENYSGNVDADLTFQGKLSSIEKEKYEEFNALGKIALKSMVYESPDLPYSTKIHFLGMEFSPHHVDVKSFEANIGKSDISASGKINNIFSYIFKDEVLKGTFDLASKKLDLNELMGPEEEIDTTVNASTGEVDTVMEVVEVPKNLAFTLNSNLKKVYYDNMEMENVKGKIILENGIAILEQLHMNMLGGSLVVNGSYSTENPEVPNFDFGMEIDKFDMIKTANTFATVQKLAPIMKRAQGLFSTDLKLSTKLNKNMMPDYGTMNGSGSLSTNMVQLRGAETVNKLGDNLKLQKFSDPMLQNLKIAFEITDGKLMVKPFDIAFGASKGKVTGFTTLNQEIDYTFNLKVPRSEFGSNANQIVDGLVSQLNSQGTNMTVGNIVPVDVFMTGTVTDPKFKVSLSQNGKSAIDAAKEKLAEELKKKKEELEQKAREEAEKRKKEAEQKAREEAEKAKKKAEEEAEKAKKQAEEAKKKAEEEAEKARKKAEEEKKRLEEEAKKKAEEEKKKLKDKLLPK